MVRRLLALRLGMNTEDYEFVRNHTLLVAHTMVFFALLFQHRGQLANLKCTWLC